MAGLHVESKYGKGGPVRKQELQAGKEAELPRSQVNPDRKRSQRWALTYARFGCLNASLRSVVPCAWTALGFLASTATIAPRCGGHNRGFPPDQPSASFERGGQNPGVVWPSEHGDKPATQKIEFLTCFTAGGYLT